MTAQTAQGHFPLDSFSAADIKLESIDLRYGNVYRINKIFSQDSVFIHVPKNLPKGYYEAYYDNDTNRLALTYYHFGHKAYSQQYYRDGSMKSDTEYDRYGNMHGLHVLYNLDGDEIWHADYWHGALENKYTLEYIDIYNYTQELIKSGKAWGCYEFTPTPMRERHDYILLKADSSFVFHDYKADCDCRRHVAGRWTLEGKLLKLTLPNSRVWGITTRYFAIVANHQQKQARLIEVLPWGANWYASEFWYCPKCDCK